MSKRRRPKKGPSAKKSAGRRGGAIPPWLFYTLAGLFAVAAFSLMFWGMINPPP